MGSAVVFGLVIVGLALVGEGLLNVEAVIGTGVGTGAGAGAVDEVGEGTG